MEEIYQGHPEIPIVIVTREESLDAAVRAFRCNVLDYLFKPPEVVELLPLIKKTQTIKGYQFEKEQI